MSTLLLEGDIVLGTTLVDMYVKCGMLAKAEKVLKGLPDRNTVSWNMLIVGYTKHNQVHEDLVPSRRCKMGSSRGIEKCNKIFNFHRNSGLFGILPLSTIIFNINGGYFLWKKKTIDVFCNIAHKLHHWSQKDT